ncbi:hypothetical protein M0R04_01730 [Candidatus Dojkabacteria bacterium]|jgi:hypothetical protein|nr:hypothetical protein [Candidatus Dojkabacteria bacterium]
MDSLQDLISNQREKLTKEILDSKKHISREFQDFGYRLALQLGDMGHKSLYMKLAKEKERSLLERAFSFAVDYPKATSNRGRLFMWKLKQLEEEKREKDENISK